MAETHPTLPNPAANLLPQPRLLGTPRLGTRWTFGFPWTHHFLGAEEARGPCRLDSFPRACTRLGRGAVGAS